MCKRITVKGDTLTNDWLEIDGVRHPRTISTTHQRKPKSGEKLNIGLQMDQDGAGDEMTIYWDNIDLAYPNAPPPPTGCSAPEVLSPHPVVRVGKSSLSCNGWDASGKSYVGTVVSFTR